MTRLTHLDENGAARMVDVSEKAVTEREADAEAEIIMSESAFAAVNSGESSKGDVLAAARIAAIMAAKKTADLIPLCHPIAITKAEVVFGVDEERRAIQIHVRVKTKAQTGVEMEALTAASVGALTIYDMIKAVDREAQITHVRLIKKSGGKSGTFVTSPSAREVHVARAGTRKASALSDAAPSHSSRTRARPPGAGPLPLPIARSNRAKGSEEREAFRAFMTSHRLRATEWAKEAGVPASQIFAYLTGRAHQIPRDVVERLARAARVRAEDLFR